MNLPERLKEIGTNVRQRLSEDRAFAGVVAILGGLVVVILLLRWMFLDF